MDVLRASTTVATALYYGAREIIPFRYPSEAEEMVGRMERNEVILAGERKSVKIPGFDLGNSPLEYLTGVVSNKVILFCTTNGTRMMKRVGSQRNVLLSAFVNMSSVVERLISDARDVLILCSGHEGGFSLEDSVCSGMIISRLRGSVKEYRIELGDEATAAEILYDHFKDDLMDMAMSSSHGRNLIDSGMEEDVRFCMMVDKFNIVPELRSGVWVSGKRGIEK